MKVLITIVLCVGSLVTLVGSIMFLVVAFRQSVLWGLAVLFLPFANIVFLIKYWYEAKKAFLIQLAGIGVSISGTIIGAMVGVRTITSKMKSGAIPMQHKFSFEQPSKGKIKTIIKKSPARRSYSHSTRKSKKTAKKLIGEQGGIENNFVGMRIEDATRILGKPMAVLKTSGKAIYRYQDIELTSEDGITVTSQNRY